MLDEPELEVHFLTHQFAIHFCFPHSKKKKRIILIFIFSSTLFFFFQDELLPLSIYHPSTEELIVPMGTPIEGFFSGAEFATPATSVATHGVPAETSTSPTEPVPIDEGTHTGEANEVTAPLAETSSVQRGATLPTATQIKTTPVTPLIISTGDPFVALSQVVKDGSSLVVTHSSIPISATCGPDAALSFEESKDVLEDLDDEPVLGMRIFESEEKEFMGMCYLSSLFLFFFFFSFFFFFFAKFTIPLLSVCPFLSFADPFEGLGLAADVGASAATTPAAPTTPIPAISSAPASAIFTTSVSAIPSIPVSVLHAVPIITGPSELYLPLFLSSFFFF